jgi:sorting nexin-4
MFICFLRLIPDGSWPDAIALTSLWRRYSQFELLRAYLENTYPHIITPCLPEKKALYSWNKAPSDTFDPDFVDRRRAGLEVRTNFVYNENTSSRIDKILSMHNIFSRF